MSLSQIIGNVCVAIAALIFLVPLQHLLRDYARKYLNNDQWVRPVLFIFVPVWLLLMVALMCVTASGGFDGLRLGRPSLYALTVAATVALAVVSFVLVAMYIRPGFAPRVIYIPPLYLVHLGTMLLVMVSLNPQLAFGISPQVVLLPWTIFAALSLVACVGFFGFRLLAGSLAGIAHRLGQVGPASEETLAKISTLDPQRDFAELAQLAEPFQSRKVRETAVARLRMSPNFIEALAADLNSREPSAGLGLVESTTFSPDELAKLALPTRKAIERFIADIPAPNYTPPERRKQLRAWGRKTFAAIAKKFASTEVDFAPTLAAFEQAFVQEK